MGCSAWLPSADPSDRPVRLSVQQQRPRFPQAAQVAGGPHPAACPGLLGSRCHHPRATHHTKLGTRLEFFYLLKFILDLQNFSLKPLLLSNPDLLLAGWFSNIKNLTSYQLAGSIVKRTGPPIGWPGQLSCPPIGCFFSHRTNLTSNWLAGSAIKRTCIPIGWLGQPSKEPALLLVGWVNHQKNLHSFWLANSAIK